MKKALQILTLSSLFLAACQPAGKDSAGEAAGTVTAELTDAEQQAYLTKGKEIAQATFAELSGELAAAMEEGGVPEAIRYCQLAAYPLVDSLSRVHQAVIRRTSLKVRNPADKPTAVELAALNEYHRQEGELSPKVVVVDGEQVAFFAPIKIQPLCLNCHGQVGADPGVKAEDYAVIKEHYPQDEATGYSLDELRGMWSITFRR